MEYPVDSLISSVGPQADQGFAPLERAIEGLLPRWIPPLVHRLNNALAVIHGAAALERTATWVHHANREFAEARTLLRHLALMARQSPAHFEVFDLGELVVGIGKLIRPLSEALGVDLDVRAPPGVVPIRSDRSRLAKLMAFLATQDILEPERNGTAELAPSRVRITLVTDQGRVAATSARWSPEELERGPLPLQAKRWAAELGGKLAFHSLGRSGGWRIVFPSLAPAEGAERPLRDHVP